jgi:hypothetical protein
MKISKKKTKQIKNRYRMQSTAIAKESNKNKIQLIEHSQV